MEPEPPGAAFFCLEPEPTQVGRSRSRLRDLGHLEPEPPNKVDYILFGSIQFAQNFSLVKKFAPHRVL